MSGAPRQYLFVSGCSRSGTTLIANVLAAQPKVSVRSDLLGEAHVAAERCGGFDRTLDARERNATLSMLKWSLRGERARPLCGPDDFATVGDAYRCALDAIADDGDRIVGHKVNCEFRYSARLLRETDHRVLYVVRDPRDVALSRRHFVFDQEGPHVGAGLCREAMRELKAHGDHPRLRVIRFEDFVRDFDAVARELTEFLGVEVTRVAEVRGHNGEAWLDNSAFHDVDRLLDPRVIGRWRAHLHDPTVRFAAWHCREELRDLGYDTFPGPFDLAERMRFKRLEWARQANRGARASWRQLMERLRR